VAKGFFDDKEFVSSGGDSIEDVLISWGNEVIADLKKSLSESTRKGGTKNLEQSLVVLPIKFAGDKWTLQFRAEDYWEFVNKGVQGIGGTKKKDGSKWPNRGAGSPFKFKKGPKVSDISQFANTYGFNKYALRESIAKSGLKPTHFFDKVVNDALKRDLISRLEKAAAREITLTLTKDFK